MGANSTLRRAVKAVSHKALGEGGYAWLQAGAMAWDIRRGTLSEPEIDLIGPAVKTGETAVDVGANYGMYTHPLSRAVGEKGKVLAFEPIPFTVETLRRIGKILRWTNVEIAPKACGVTNESVTFTVPMQASGALSAGQAHLAGRDDSRPGHERHVRWPDSTEVTCEVVRLDDYIDPSSDVSFVKSDTEGAELFVFRGGESLIDKYLPTVVAEINPWFLEGFEVTVPELTGFFTSRDYALMHYDDRKGRLEEIEPEDLVEDNYVFVHPSRRDRFRALLP